MGTYVLLYANLRASIRLYTHMYANLRALLDYIHTNSLRFSRKYESFAILLVLV